MDDELPGLTYLRMLCEQLNFVEVERCFDSPAQFLKEYQHLSHDVCLLDINMPGISGIEVAQLLKNKPVIFISAHPEFAINAFELDAVDFIKKPVTKDRLEKALLKVKARLSEPGTKDYFTWNTHLGKSTVYFNEVLYITTSNVDSRDKTAWLRGGHSLTLKNITIEKLLELLPGSGFARVNKSDIVNRRAVQAYTADDIVMKLKDQRGQQLRISLGDTYKKAFFDWVK